MKESEVMQIQYMISLAYIEKVDHIILNDVLKFMEKDDPKPSGPEALFWLRGKNMMYFLNEWSGSQYDIDVFRD